MTEKWGKIQEKWDLVWVIQDNITDFLITGNYRKLTHQEIKLLEISVNLVETTYK